MRASHKIYIESFLSNTEKNTKRERKSSAMHSKTKWVIYSKPNLNWRLNKWNFLVYSNSMRKEVNIFIHLVSPSSLFYIAQLQFLSLNHESPEQTMDSFKSNFLIIQRLNTSTSCKWTQFSNYLFCEFDFFGKLVTWGNTHKTRLAHLIMQVQF